MSQFGGFYKGEKKKLKKAQLERKAQAVTGRQTFSLPTVQIIKKGKNEA